eukprot:SAG31_NODE_18231_length_642_cov_1.753223_1_plen_85_part_01
MAVMLRRALLRGFVNQPGPALPACARVQQSLCCCARPSADGITKRLAGCVDGRAQERWLLENDGMRRARGRRRRAAAALLPRTCT